MTTLVYKVLYPMDLKRYMVLSFATLWTLVLIMALVTAIVHQVNYQDSASQFNLEWRIGNLQSDIVNKDKKVLELEDIIISKNTYITELEWMGVYP